MNPNVKTAKKVTGGKIGNRQQFFLKEEREKNTMKSKYLDQNYFQSKGTKNDMTLRFLSNISDKLVKKN